MGQVAARMSVSFSASKMAQFRCIFSRLNCAKLEALGMKLPNEFWTRYQIVIDEDVLWYPLIQADFSSR